MPNNYRVRRIFIVRPWPSLCSPMLPDTDVRCPRVGSSLTEILVEINSQLLSRFLSWTKELIFEERTTTNKPWRNRIEDIFEGKEEREKETRRYSRIVLNAETRGWIALKPTRRPNFLVDVCKKGYLFHGRPHSQGRSQPRQDPMPIQRLDRVNFQHRLLNLDRY